MLRLDEDLSRSTRWSPRTASSRGPTRRRTDDAQPDGLRGRGQDDLHDQLRVVGDRADGHARSSRSSASRDGGRTFPTPAAMAKAAEDFYRDVVRAGYRGAYLRSLAAAVAYGELDLEALDGRSELPDEEVERAAAGAARRRPVRGGARDDAARPLRAADPRLVDAPDLRADRTAARRQATGRSSAGSAATATTPGSRSGSTSRATGSTTTRSPSESARQTRGREGTVSIGRPLGAASDLTGRRRERHRGAERLERRRGT